MSILTREYCMNEYVQYPYSVQTSTVQYEYMYMYYAYTRTIIVLELFKNRTQKHSCKAYKTKCTVLVCRVGVPNSPVEDL